LDNIDQEILNGYNGSSGENELTLEDQAECMREVDESLRTLTKANLVELKAFTKPHLLV
jgi:hypothetical protein